MDKGKGRAADWYPVAAGSHVSKHHDVEITDEELYDIAASTDLHDESHSSQIRNFAPAQLGSGSNLKSEIEGPSAMPLDIQADDRVLPIDYPRDPFDESDEIVIIREVPAAIRLRHPRVLHLTALDSVLSQEAISAREAARANTTSRAGPSTHTPATIPRARPDSKSWEHKVLKEFDFNKDSDVSAFMRLTAPAHTATTGLGVRTRAPKFPVPDPFCTSPPTRTELVELRDTHSGASSTVTPQGVNNPLESVPEVSDDVARRSGLRISAPERLILARENLPEQNTFSWDVKKRPMPLERDNCSELMIRQRFDMVHDEWHRLQHECPQFPLQDEHVTVPHRCRHNQMRYVRLERMENGDWLEQAYCSFHQRYEFNATRGLIAHRVATEHRERQRLAGKRAVYWSSVLFPVGGFVVLKHLADDRGVSAAVMRLASGQGRVDQPHEDERRLAGLMFEIMLLVWAAIIFTACAVLVWITTR